MADQPGLAGLAEAVGSDLKAIRAATRERLVGAGDPGPEAGDAVSPPEKVDVIIGWQDIADELGVSVRRAQRLEKNAGLPVHRPKGARIVNTTRAKLQAWADGQEASAKGGRQ